MKYNVNFTKVVASGNDFILIDSKSNPAQYAKLNFSSMAKDLCRRHLSIGADGILVLEGSKKADFKMRIINPDGSEVDMCGNGARCSALYGADRGWGRDLSFETGAGIIKAMVKGEVVKLKMSDPRDAKLNIGLDISGKKITGHFINSGVPHVVCIVDNLNNYDVKDIGSRIRNHPMFRPKGTNADFVKVVDKASGIIRTYERGVEDETLACGTGVAASAVILAILDMGKSPFCLKTKSGEEIIVYYEKSGEIVKNVYLEGKASIVYEGKV